MEKQVIAVCGKGGVGKTAFSAILSRVLIDADIRPLLLIDADPAGGLAAAINESAIDSLAAVRDRLIASARKGETMDVASKLDYLLLRALVERQKYSLLAMGHSSEKGCFCPANSLLRRAIDLLVSAFVVVLIDAEAGIEQINRDVTRGVTQIITVLDGSQKSISTLRLIAEMVHSTPISVVGNRMAPKELSKLPGNLELIGVVPENQALRQFDCEGRSLWELPPENEAVVAVRDIAKVLKISPNNGCPK
jgi:CO dehydrogenase maturation factor